MIQFLDQYGNPVPSGLGVTITEAGGSVVGTGTTNGAGSAAINIPNGVALTASFTGSNAPPNISFIGGTRELLTRAGEVLTSYSQSPLLAREPAASTILIIPDYNVPTGLTATTNVTLTAPPPTCPAVQTSRMLSLLPRSWFSDVAWSLGGVLYAVLYAIGVLFCMITSIQIPYVQLQKRISTATDVNLDAIGHDYFGPNYNRALLYESGILNEESDAQFCTRIKSDILAPKNTLAAIQAAVEEYFATFFFADVFASYLPGQTVQVPTAPTNIIVFDRQSNPTLSAEGNLQPGQFCILLTFANLQSTGFFLNHSFIGNKSFLVTDAPVFGVYAPTPALDALVEKTKAAGMQQVYAISEV